MHTVSEINDAYSLWAERFVEEGWDAYLLTFMFDQLGGPPDLVAAAIRRDIERVYATLLPRIVRRPTARTARGSLPVWFCALDRPVAKRAKLMLRDVVINGGLHGHAVAFLPPWSRLTVPLDEHLLAHEQGLYLRPGCPLARLDVVPITSHPGYVTGYARKHTLRSTLGMDADFMLPRSLEEL